jgi:pimeloyl-ACP methyl ester carboxylesterase
VDHKDSISALSLIGPTGIGLHGEEPDLRDALLNRVLRLPVLGTSTLNLYTSHAAISRHLRREVFSAPERVDAALVEHHYRSSHQPGSHLALAAFLSGFLNHSCDEALRRLEAPVCLAWGRQAVSPPIEAADLWLQRLPQEAEIEVIADSGSLPHLETPALFCRVLDRFLERHDS